MKPFLVQLLFFMAAAVSVPSLRAHVQRRELSADADQTECPDRMATCKPGQTSCGSLAQIYHEQDATHETAWCTDLGTVYGVCKEMGSLRCCDNREYVKEAADKCTKLKKGSGSAV